MWYQCVFGLFAVCCSYGCGSSDINVNSGSSHDISDKDELLEPDDRVSNIVCSEYVGDNPRGFSGIQCMSPGAQKQCDLLTDLLLKSCVKHPAKTYLVDDSFGWDQGWLTRDVEALALQGRQPELVFYIANGASARKEGSPVPHLQRSVASFRDAIQYDPALRARYSALVARVIPVLRRARELGAGVRLIPFLEDNFTDKAFAAALDLTRKALPADLQDIKLGRNPCPGCAPGNSNNIPSGLFRDLHTNTGNFHNPGGMVVDDGFVLTSQEKAPIFKAAAEQGAIAIDWGAGRQGCAVRDGKPVCGTDPATRQYYTPTEAEQSEMVKLVRGEL